MQIRLSAVSRGILQAVVLTFLLLFALCPLAKAQNASQWQALAPVEGANITALHSAEGRVYAATQLGGVFVSDDGGKTWRPANRGLEGQGSIVFGSTDGVMLAGTFAGIFRSTDGGQNWTAATGPLLSGRGFARSGGMLFALSNNGRLLVSNDSGRTWTARSVIPGNPLATKLALFGDTLLVGTARGIFRSPDQGLTWSASRAGLPNNGEPSVQALEVNGDKFYLGTSIYGSFPNYAPQVYVSSDSGQSWAALGSTITMLVGGLSLTPAVYSLAFDGANVYAANSYGVAQFDGQGWSEVVQGRGLPLNLQGTSFARSGDTLLYGTISGGVFSFSKGATNWQASNSGLTAANVNVIATNEQSIFISAGAAGTYRSDDNGQSWTRMTGIQAITGRPVIVNQIVTKGNQIFAGTADGGVFYSKNNGVTWGAINRGFFLPTLNIFDMALSKDKVYILQGATLYSFIEGSEEWGRVLSGTLSAIRLAFGENVIYGGGSGGVHRSTDDGFSFQLVPISEVSIVGTLAARGKEVFAGGFGPNVTPRLLYSNNEGASYQLTRLTSSARGFAFNSEFTYCAATGGFFYSTNGLNWTPVNAGLPTNLLSSVAARGAQVFVGTSGLGVFIATNPHLQPGALANVSAASFTAGTLAPDSLATAFGENLANTTASATQLPLPTTLGGTRVLVRDGAGNEINAPLFFVSPTQINYQVPVGAAPGKGAVIVISGDNRTALGEVQFANVAPGLFTANANGQGPAAAVALRVKADGTQSYETIGDYDAAGRFVLRPLDLGPESDQVFVLLFGTGFRLNSGLSAVSVRIGGADAPVAFAGAVAGLAGLDQANVRIPRTLAGRGAVEVILTADGKTTNSVRLNVR